MGEFRMPALGADMDEGTLVQWLVKPGDAVHRGDLVAVIDTAKTAMEIEAFEDGVVQELLVAPGATVPVGAPLARIGLGAPAPVAAPPVVAPPVPGPPVAAPPVAGALPATPLVRRLARQRHVALDRLHGTGPGGVITRADVEQAAKAAGPTPAPPVPGRPVGRPPMAQPPAEPGARVPASPYARRRAAELGVALGSVQGTGPGGAVRAQDVAAAAVPAAPAPDRPHPAPEPAGARRPPSEDRALAMRRAIGALMARSKREVPHYYLTATIDVSRATAYVRELNVGRPVADRLVPAALLLKAAALAARRVPEVNGFWVDDRFAAAEAVHLGVAISLRQGGLVAPAIHDADALDVDTLMARLRDLVTRARAGRLRQSEMSDPTLTVTNLGELGVDSVHGVIYAPQVALVGFGRIAQRPWAQDGMLTVRDVVVATLAADHRASDGHRGGRYLSIVDELLQKPEEL